MMAIERGEAEGTNNFIILISKMHILFSMQLFFKIVPVVDLFLEGKWNTSILF